MKISGFLEFCAKLGPADSFLKSASYLLHGGNFARVRSFLVEHSATVLQDDSGIPLGYFDQKKWRLQPFGHYLPPLGIFPNAYQPRLADLFHNAARSTSALAIGGARTNRTCCSPRGCRRAPAKPNLTLR